HVSGVHTGALGGRELLHYAFLGGLDLVLHLHGFHNHNLLAGLDLVFFVHQQTDYLPWHWCCQSTGPLLPSGTIFEVAQGARIAQFGCTALISKLQMNLRSSLSALDLE